MTVLKFLWTTLLGGVIVIVPIGLAAAGIVKAVAIARDILAPIADRLPETMHFRTLVALGFVLAVCFAAGVLLRTAIGRAAARAADKGLLERIPGYTLYRTLSRRIGGQQGQEMEVAAIRMDDHELLAFVMERFPDGRCAIFVPSSPTPAVGSMLIVPAERVRVLDIPMKQALGCLTQWGVGTSAVVSGTPARATEA